MGQSFTTTSTTQLTMNKSPLAIIVPMLNEAPQLPELLTHLRQWQDRGCEIILVDGGSSDASTDLARAAGFTVIAAPQGRARQMNTGAKVARGDILLFLHADTRLPQEADVLVKAAVAGGNRIWGRFDVRLDGNHWTLPIVAWFMNQRSRLTGIATGDQAMFVRATDFKAMGGFADLPLMEDIELSTRLCRLSAPTCLSQKVATSARRWLENGVWQTIWLMWQLRWAYWRGTPAQVLAERYR